MKLEGPILLGTDFSAASDEALRQANDLATDRGTTLIVCHVVPALETVNILFPQLAARDEERRDTLTAQATLAMERQVTAILGDGAEAVSTVVDSGTPHAGLLAQAEATNAGLIVLGPGRTAERVVRHASCPGAHCSPWPAWPRHRRDGLLGSVIPGAGSGGIGSPTPWLTTATAARRRHRHIRVCWRDWRRAPVLARHSGRVPSDAGRAAACSRGPARRHVDPFGHRWRGAGEVGTCGTDHRRFRSLGASRTRRRRHTRSHRPCAIDARQHGRSHHSLGPVLGPRGPAHGMTTVLVERSEGPAAAPSERPSDHHLKAGHGLASWLLTRDHRRIAILY